MTEKEYRTMTEKELKGRKVRTLKDLGSHIQHIPKGTILTIEGKGGGLRLASKACPTCGVVVYIRGVIPQEVELLKD